MKSTSRLLSAKKVVVGSLMALLLVSTGTVGFARPAQAADWDSPIQVLQQTITAVTEGKVLTNPIFYRIAQAAIQSMVRSTVNWINSGFQGSPAYATDLRATIQDAADQEAGRFLTTLRTNLALQSPFGDQVARDVLAAYYISTGRDSFSLQNRFTLNNVTSNPAGLAAGDLRNGGIRGFIAETINPANNYFGARDAAERALDTTVGAVTGQIHEEVANGGGFFSYRKCDVGNGGSVPILGSDGQPTGQTSPIYTASTSLTPSQTCLQSHIETPGSVIAANINHSLGLGADSLVQARDFDQIVNALMAQLMQQVLGPNGLGGLSSASASTGGRNYFSQPVTQNNTTSGSAVGTFFNVITAQTSQVQTYLTNWQTINNAALAAKAALEQSTCVPNADQIITDQVQPVITQAATAIGTVPSALASLDSLRNQTLNATALASNQQPSALAQISADYQNLLSGSDLPDTTAMTYAATQAQDSGNTVPVSLLTKMNQLTAQAQCGG